jgi:hypothetical protein
MITVEVDEKRQKVSTPLGTGFIVYELPSGRVLVEFDHGDGHVFFREEVQVIPQRTKPCRQREFQRIAS